MAYWLASERTVQDEGVLTRFDPRYWTVDFPRPMMAAATVPAPDTLRVDAVFYRTDDLAGLIWWAADVIDHPLLRYETARDFRRCVLSFRWQSAGVLPLDAVNGPTLTIEGRDAAGTPRAWYVRLWNYARGVPDDARVTLDFAALDGGFLLPGETDPVWAGDIDRMFVSLVAPGYTGASGALTQAVEGWAELSGMTCTGAGAVLRVGEVVVPPHGYSVATGYDDCYNLTPDRVAMTALRLGYRERLVHYVGMSHYFRLDPVTLLIDPAAAVLNVAAAAWNRAYAGIARSLGIELIWSMSFEILDQHCPASWKQRAADGTPALTGWVPPSTLVSPASVDGVAYLAGLAAALLAIGAEAGLAPKLQLGEPWWWVTRAAQPCLYDAAAWPQLWEPGPIDLRADLDAVTLQVLDRAGAMLGAATAGVLAAARAAQPGVETHLLVYLPTLLAPDMPEARRLNLPIAWAAPAFDRLQIEDYDWVTDGATGRSAEGAAAITRRLGYPVASQDYLTGFVLRAEDRAHWARIDAAGRAARARGVGRVVVWALPQIMRDGFVAYPQPEESDVQAFDDVSFPLALGREAEVAPAFSTAVSMSAGGREERVAQWAGARTGYDVGPGLRSEADIAVLLGFFRARLGPARGFRLCDPFDASSGGDMPTAIDQPIGTGDGAAVRFALAKRYGEEPRRITRPVPGSVRVAVDGIETSGFTVDPGGWVVLATAPAAGVAVTAGYVFDVPVRFAEDRLSVSLTSFRAGIAHAVPLIELREDDEWTA